MVALRAIMLTMTRLNEKPFENLNFKQHKTYETWPYTVYIWYMKKKVTS